jgi:single-stranded-DNA-specific exonuclease
MIKVQERKQLSDPSIFSDMDPFSSKLFANRTTDPRKTNSLASILDPNTMKGLTKAADIIVESIDKRRRIVVIADYDADGATGCAIALTGLSMFGANVNYIVPNRFSEGYGLSPQVVERALELKPDIFLTVDNGIASHAGIIAAGNYGIPVVVTDHHMPADTLPDALAIVNPNQPGCEFQSKNLAGCGVMFYLMIAIRAKYRSISDPRGSVDLRKLLDILAIGTVADLVKLDFNNRVLVQAGLQRIRQGMARAGVEKLFNVTKTHPSKASSDHLGFYIGPRINAAGRMDDASVGIACLSTPDDGLAIRLAESLHATNSDRRTVQKNIEEEALNSLPKTVSDEQCSICIFDKQWHEGVIGVVASRLKEKFYRPSIVLTQVDESTAKGSGRSIPGFNLRDAIDLIDKQNPGLIKKFGGHPMAAGLTIDINGVERFKIAFESIAKKLLSPSDLKQIIEHDGVITSDLINVRNAELIESNVWGQAFPTPSFVIEQPKILKQRILNEAHLKLELQIQDQKIDAIWFGKATEVTQGQSLLGSLKVNEYQGNVKPQFTIQMEV